MGRTDQLKSEQEINNLLQLLREIRIEKDLRQSDLAKRLNQHQSFVSKYESGERRLDILEIRRICDALEITLETFIKRLEKALSE